MNIKKIIRTGAILILLGACTKSLIKLPTTSIGEPAFWKTRDDAVQGVNGIYRALQNGSLYGGDMRYCAVYTNDAVASAIATGYTYIQQNSGFNSSTANVEGVWSAWYNVIARANNVLANVPKIVMDTTLRTRLLGEAHFLRGLSYFYLNFLWGKVPLVLTPINVSEENLFRAGSDTILNQALSDLGIAEQTLPASYSTSDIGRATSTAATALKSRIYLYNQMWSQAAASASKVISISGLGLVAGSGYANMFQPAGKNNKTESIFEVQFLGGTGQGLGSNFNRYSSSISTSYYTISPQKNLAKAFESGDIRFPATILNPGTSFAGVTYTGSLSPTGIGVVKSVIPDASISTDGSANFVVIRYAEMLLNYAEATNELQNTPDQSVYDAVNKIRKRAGLGDLVTGLTKVQMRAIIKQEDRVEFSWEGHHFYDLIRWSRAGGNDYQAAMEAVSGAISGDIRTYDPKLLLWPVPLQEINIAPNLSQNPGW